MINPFATTKSYAKLVSLVSLAAFIAHRKGPTSKKKPFSGGQATNFVTEL